MPSLYFNNNAACAVGDIASPAGLVTSEQNGAFPTVMGNTDAATCALAPGRPRWATDDTMPWPRSTA